MTATEKQNYKVGKIPSHEYVVKQIIFCSIYYLSVKVICAFLVIKYVHRKIYTFLTYHEVDYLPQKTILVENILS